MSKSGFKKGRLGIGTRNTIHKATFRGLIEPCQK